MLNFFHRSSEQKDSQTEKFINWYDHGWIVITEEIYKKDSKF